MNTQQRADAPRVEDEGEHQATAVLTLRDVFAVYALQGCIANPTGADGFTFEQRAKWVYMQADAMLEARRK